MSCPNFWTSLVLKSILEECGVLVQPAQDKVFLTLTVPGPLDAIKTAADELQSKYPHSSPIHIEGLEPVPSTPPSTNGAHADPPPSSVPQRCASTTAWAASASCPRPWRHQMRHPHQHTRRLASRTPAAVAMTDPGAPGRVNHDASAPAATTTPPVVPAIARWDVPARQAALEPIVWPVNPDSAPVHDGQSERHRSVYSHRPRNRAVTVVDPHPGLPFTSSARNTSSSASGACCRSRRVLVTG